MKPQAPGVFLLALLLAACQPATGPAADPAPAPGDGPAAADADVAPSDPEPADTDADAAPRPDEPGLKVATIDGSEYDIADHRGKWVVVNFWATWCSPCLKEMPELSALHTMREHISVVGLAYEEIDVPSMQSFLAEHPVAYPIAIIDVYAPPADFETPRGLPMTYLIAPDGKVARQFLGPVTAKEIETAIEGSGGPALESLPGAAADAEAAAEEGA
jgi:thiol-disulfide isomerase/thioredoxin